MLNEGEIDTFNKDIVIEFLDYLENVKQNSISTRNNRFQNICSFLKFVYPNESTRILQFQNIFDIPLKKDIEKPMEYMTVDILKILLLLDKSGNFDVSGDWVNGTGTYPGDLNMDKRWVITVIIAKGLKINKEIFFFCWGYFGRIK